MLGTIYANLLLSSSTPPTILHSPTALKLTASSYISTCDSDLITAVKPSGQYSMLFYVCIPLSSSRSLGDYQFVESREYNHTMCVQSLRVRERER